MPHTAISPLICWIGNPHLLIGATVATMGMGTALPLVVVVPLVVLPPPVAGFVSVEVVLVVVPKIAPSFFVVVLVLVVVVV